MKSSVTIESVLFDIQLPPLEQFDYSDLEGVKEKLAALPYAMLTDYMDRDRVLSVRIKLPFGAVFDHFAKTRIRQITDIVAAAERKAQKRIEHAKRKAEAKPRLEGESHAGAGDPGGAGRHPQ